MGVLQKMTIQHPVFEIRRENLRELIDSRFEGNRSAFARAANKNVNLINLALTTNLDLRRTIGEKLARDMEKALSLPEGWLDVDRSKTSSEAAIIAIPKVRGVKAGLQMLPDKLYVGSAWLEKTVSAASAADKLCIWHAHDDSMVRDNEGINPGDVLIVDTGVDQTALSDGVYLLDISGVQVVRRVQKLLDGMYRLKTDNQVYEAVTLNPKKDKTVKIIGKVLSKIRHSAV